MSPQQFSLYGLARRLADRGASNSSSSQVTFAADLAMLNDGRLTFMRIGVAF